MPHLGVEHRQHPVVPEGLVGLEELVDVLDLTFLGADPLQELLNTAPASRKAPAWVGWEGDLSGSLYYGPMQQEQVASRIVAPLKQQVVTGRDGEYLIAREAAFE